MVAVARMVLDGTPIKTGMEIPTLGPATVDETQHVIDDWDNIGQAFTRPRACRQNVITSLLSNMDRVYLMLVET